MLFSEKFYFQRCCFRTALLKTAAASWWVPASSMIESFSLSVMYYCLPTLICAAVDEGTEKERMWLAFDVKRGRAHSSESKTTC